MEPLDAGPLEPRTPPGMRGSSEGSPGGSPTGDGPEDDDGDRVGRWMKVSGDSSVLAQFRSEVRSRFGEVDVYTAVSIDQSALVHSTQCRRAGPDANMEFLLCSRCSAEIQSTEDRLVLGVDGVLHRALECPHLREVRGGFIHRYCSVCFLGDADET